MALATIILYALPYERERERERENSHGYCVLLYLWVSVRIKNSLVPRLPDLFNALQVKKAERGLGTRLNYAIVYWCVHWISV